MNLAPFLWLLCVMMLFHSIIIFLLKHRAQLVQVLVLHLDLIIREIGVVFVVGLVSSDFIINVVLDSLFISLSLDITHITLVLGGSGLSLLLSLNP